MSACAILMILVELVDFVDLVDLLIWSTWLICGFGRFVWPSRWSICYFGQVEIIGRYGRSRELVSRFRRFG